MKSFKNYIKEAMKVDISGTGSPVRPLSSVRPLPPSVIQSLSQSSQPSQPSQQEIDAENAERKAWEQKNPYEAKVFAEEERLANESSAKRKQEWEKQQAERKQWWSNPQNERKAIEWDARNPRPESGYALIQWQQKRAEAGIMDREEKEFTDISAKQLSKPWKPKPMPYKPRPYM